MPATSLPIDRPRKIEAIRRLPSELNATIDGLTDSQLDIPYREGGWTPRQIVHHIADSHMNAFIRMKLVLAEEHATFKPYDQDVWAKMPDYGNDLAPSLAIITGIQERMADVLSSAKDEEWSRTAYHPENGEMTLDDLLDMYTGHGKHHVDQILSLRERMGW
jgi:uncharacterized damage-inducible protein DinB